MFIMHEFCNSLKFIGFILTILVATSSGADVKLTDVHHALQVFGVQRTIVLPPIPDVSLLINSTELSRSGEWVEVSWSGLQNPQRDDLVALYIPAGGFSHHPGNFFHKYLEGMANFINPHLFP